MSAPRTGSGVPFDGDAIVAIATPPGRGGVGIVRLSGSRVPDLAPALIGTLPPPGRAARRTFRDASGEPIDDGLAIYFTAPHSFTGEHVLELHGHGGTVVMDLLVARCLEVGARAARPGEFSERAFLNGKLDLAQAEAIADLIDAGSAAAARAALRSLSGEFSVVVNRLADELVALRTYIEAAIDFADEDLELLAEGAVRARLDALLTAMDELTTTAEQGRLLHEGCTIVLAGRPNAGKSSLMNVLAGHDAAIVTHVPGTTRDVLRERIDIGGLPVMLIDTAGLRESPDLIEAEGMRRARREIEQADRILYVVDSADADAMTNLPRDLAALSVPGNMITVVLNKSDLSSVTGDVAKTPPEIAVSASRGNKIDVLRAHLIAALGYHPEGTGAISARRRHLDALQRARQHLYRACAEFDDHSGAELVAEELKLAHEAVGEVTGRFSSDDLLGRVFSTFCIGK